MGGVAGGVVKVVLALSGLVQHDGGRLDGSWRGRPPDACPRGDLSAGDRRVVEPPAGGAHLAALVGRDPRVVAGDLLLVAAKGGGVGVQAGNLDVAGAGAVVGHDLRGGRAGALEVLQAGARRAGGGPPRPVRVGVRREGAEAGHVGLDGPGAGAGALHDGELAGGVVKVLEVVLLLPAEQGSAACMSRRRVLILCAL